MRIGVHTVYLPWFCCLKSTVANTGADIERHGLAPDARLVLAYVEP